MNKVLLLLVLTVVAQAQSICPAVVHPCELDYEGNVKPVGVENTSACFGSAQRQCERLVGYVCDKQTVVIEDELNGKMKTLNSKVKSLTVENKALKTQLKRAKLQLRRK